MTRKYRVLTDETMQQEVRYLSFVGNFNRYDFAITNDKDSGNKLVIDMRKNRFAVLSKEDLTEEGGIEHAFHVTEIEADELREFLGEKL